MGGNVSYQVALNHQRDLGQLCGPMTIHITDPFWSRLARTPVQMSALNPKEVQRVMEPYCQQLVVNSRKTQNLQTLMVRVLGIAREKEDDEQQRMAANGICLLKFIVKSLLEKLPGSDFVTFMDGHPPGGSLLHNHRPDPNGMLTRLVTTLLDIVIDGADDGIAYLVLVEALECLVVGCSTQLYVEYVSWNTGMHPVLEILMEQRENAAPVIQNLLHWYIDQWPSPPGVKIYQTPTDATPSVLKFVRKAAASVLWLPVTAYKYLVGGVHGKGFSPLATAAQQLLFVLVHHVPYNSPTANPFRTALRSLHDATFIGGIESNPIDIDNTAPSVSFAELYLQLSQSLQDERGTLMLYTMIQCARAFGDYALVRIEMETLMLPILKQVYEASSGSQSQLYLLSIILLIFSQDTALSHNLHKIIITVPEWYKERPMRTVPLGSFMIVLLLRMAHSNLISSRDLYLHTNTMAALANVMSTAMHLDSYAAQRFMDMVDLLARRYRKLLAHQQDIVGTDIEFRVQFYNDFLQMLLEVLNGVVTSKPENNPHLVYAILQRQTLFDDFTAIGGDYAELVRSLQSLLQYFNGEINDVREAHVSDAWTAEQILKVICRTAPLWRSARRSASSTSTLRFSYEEERSAEQFFVPVVWTLIVSFSTLPWNPETVSLFTPQTPTASGLDSEDVATEPAPSAVSIGTSHEV